MYYNFILMPSKKHQSAIESNNAFMVKMEDLVKEIIIQNDIPYYRIESRMDHLQNDSGENTYLPVIRVITYFEDAVTRIAEIVSAEFDVETDYNKDKKKARPDNFANKQVQCLATLKPARQELIEYRRSGDKKFEVQICSMLQDAWAGIERELGYDNATFPEEMKRDFYRVGALLEMADLEFLKIRSQLSAKQNWINKVEEEAVQPVVDHVVSETEISEEDNTGSSINGEMQESSTVNGEGQQPALGMQYPYNPMMQQQYYPYQMPNGVPAPGQQWYHPQPMNGANGGAPGYPQMPMMGGYYPQYDPNMPFMPQQFMPQGYMQGQPYMPQQNTPAPAKNGTPSNGQAKTEPKVNGTAKAATVPDAPKQAEAAPKAEAMLAAETNKTEEKTATHIADVIAPVAAVAATVAATELPLVPDAVTDAAKTVANAANGVTLDTIDMNVDKPDTLALNINTIGHTNGTPGEALPDAINGIPVKLPAADENLIPTAITAVPVNEAPSSESVALNIDKVDTFNMNVNGMIERRTEIVTDNRDKSDENIPFYEREAKPAKSAIVDENAQMTDASLREYVSNSKLVKEVDSEVARRSGATLNSEVDVEGDVERLKFLKVYSLKQLHERIIDNKNDIIAFAEKWIGSDNGGSFDSGICLFYLEYLLVGKRNDPAFAVEYVLKFISDNDYSARFIIPTYNSISKQDKPIGAHLTLK